MKKTLFIFLIILAGVSAAVQAEVFIDWKAGFYVEYPSSWRHVDYNEVNDFLVINGIDPDVFDYDAVLAEISDRPFFEGPYIFLSYEPVGPLNSRQVDSSLKAVGAEYGERKYVQGTISKEGMNLSQNVPYYDAAARTVLTRSSVTTSRGTKVLADFRRFYEKGIAVFLCYSPGEISEARLPVFIDIISSFSTKDIEKMAPRESLRVVEVAPDSVAVGFDESGSDGGETAPAESGVSSTFMLVIIIILAIVVVVVVFGFLMKKKNI